MKKISLFLLVLALALSACAGSQAAPTAAATAPAPLETKPAAPIPSPTPVKEVQPAASSGSAKKEACSPVGLDQSLVWVHWIASKHQTQVYPLDPANGQPTCGYDPLNFREFSRSASSEDGSSLAIVDYALANSEDGKLHFVDLQSWTPVTTTVSILNWAAAMTFNPDATQLAVAYATPGAAAPNSPPAAPQPYILAVVDRASGTVVKQQRIDFNPSLLQYTPDGKSLVAFGAEENPQGDAIPLAHLLVFDARDYSLAWDAPMGDIHAGFKQRKDSGSDYIMDQWEPAAVLSTDGRELYIVHADQDKLTRVDLVDSQVTTVDIRPKLSWLERLLSLGTGIAYAKGVNGTTRQAIYLDGRLYVAGLVQTTEKDSAGNWQFTQDSLGLQVIDAQTGALLDQMDSEASQIELSPGKEALYLEGWTGNSPWTEVVSTGDLKVIRRLTGYNLHVAPLPGGGNILLAASQLSDVTRLAPVDPAALAGDGELNLNPWTALGYPLSAFP
jgi:hypothetical protein